MFFGLKNFIYTLTEILYAKNSFFPPLGFNCFYKQIF
jgi:hypothetical protein